MTSFRPHEFLSGYTSVFERTPQNRDHRPSYPKGSKLPARGEEGHLPTPSQLMALAKRLSAARSRRKDFLAPSLFGEPGWDMLLALYNAELGGYRMTVSRLCEASDGPATTALRWLATLGELDLVRRLKNPLDCRVIFIELQPAARFAIEAYLSDFWNSLFAPEDSGRNATG